MAELIFSLQRVMEICFVFKCRAINVIFSVFFGGILSRLKKVVVG